MRRWIVIALVLAVAAPVWAGELAGVVMPDQVQVGGKTLVLNGMGIRKKLWIKVYVGGLYLERPTHDAAEAIAAPGYKRVVMHFLTNKATKKRMDRAWWEGFEKNSPEMVDALRGRIEQLVGFFGDMKVGDEIVFTFDPEGKVTAELNGQVKGEIQGKDFAQALLKVWLGPHPPTEDLKAGLLGRS